MKIHADRVFGRRPARLGINHYHANRQRVLLAGERVGFLWIPTDIRPERFYQFEEIPDVKATAS